MKIRVSVLWARIKHKPVESLRIGVYLELHALFLCSRWISIPPLHQTRLRNAHHSPRSAMLAALVLELLVLRCETFSFLSEGDAGASTSYRGMHVSSRLTMQRRKHAFCARYGSYCVSSPEMAESTLERLLSCTSAAMVMCERGQAAKSRRVLEEGRTGDQIKR